ncbi:MAG TPA: porin, partial [Roseomonas sp.]
CDAYGAGFFYIPGTDTCLKVGGYVRVDYDYRPQRNSTGYIRLPNGGPGFAPGNYLYSANTGDLTTNGFYARGTVQMDARTQTAWGTVQTVMALRMDTGSGVMERIGGTTTANIGTQGVTATTLESAYIRFAGFTFGQAAQPFDFKSAWAWNTPWATGWPNGVRQLAYTHVFGGGFSATVAATDARAYNGVTSATTAAYPSSFERAGVVWVGNVRYDQSWGSAQIMGAYQRGGNVAGGDNRLIYNSPGANDVFGTNESGWAIGAGLAINLPMLASGDRIEFQAVYHDRIVNLIGDPSINNPSVGAYITNPLGGPSINFANGKGYSLLAQMRHYWLPSLRSQVYVSYTDRKLHTEADGFGIDAPVFANGCGGFVCSGAKGTAFGIGKALVWSPTRNFDIGLELTYLRARWNEAALRSSTQQWVNYANDQQRGLTEDTFIGKVRVQRNF